MTVGGKHAWAGPDLFHYSLVPVHKAIMMKYEEIAIRIISMPNYNSKISTCSSGSLNYHVSIALFNEMPMLCNKFHELRPIDVENGVFKCCYCPDGIYDKYKGECKDFVSMAISRFFKPMILEMRAGLFPLLCLSHKVSKIDPSAKRVVLNEHQVFAKILVECLVIIGRFLCDVEIYKSNRKKIPDFYYSKRMIDENVKPCPHL